MHAMKKVSKDAVIATRSGFERDVRGATLAGVVKEGLSEEMTVKEIGQESAMEMSGEKYSGQMGQKLDSPGRSTSLGLPRNRKST